VQTYPLQTIFTPFVRVAAAVIAAIFILLLMPLAANAGQAISSCTTSDGKDGVQVSVSAGGMNCVPLGGSEIKTNPIFIYVTAILKVVAGLAGLACLGGFIWGTIMYTTARANAGQTEKARMIMLNSIIGLLLFIFMFAILQFLVPGGIFTS
jgi:hypothetical protein